ncbi:ATP-binding protein [Pseudomonas corrugata]|uniref:ATP-binding protein n=1 Tax=Pseudomonas corrugata TaxID=47879 RepID=UPI0004B03150|nr:ATP-binding protein [Pseudomonas corrugata]
MFRNNDNPVVELHAHVSNGVLGEAFFDKLIDNPTYCHECEVIDFKRQLPETTAEYLKTIRDLIALHNSYGGFLVFGVEETKKDREFSVLGVPEGILDTGKIRDNLQVYVTEDIRFKPIRLNVRGFHLEVLWVAKRSQGESPVKFSKNGPEIKPKTLLFKKGDVVFRRLDNNSVAGSAEDYDFLYSSRKPPSLDLELNDLINEEPLDHNLPERSLICPKFVGRGEDLGGLWAWLADDFSRVKLIAGEGGLGKTSLAYRFAEEVATRLIRPFNKVLWLTAKKSQFIPSQDNYRNASHIDFFNADSLYKAVALGLGCFNSDFEELNSRELLQLALETCGQVPSFIVIDDVDSLVPEDQLRALELGMRMPSGTKLLLTTRVNFSFSPDNVLKLDGFPLNEFKDFVVVLRNRYGLTSLKDGKISALHSVTGGSPLFTDSLIRLERRGLPLDQAINQWKDEKGLEARKAALQREVQQLSKAAKRVLFVVSILKSCSYIELSQIVDYTEQTLGDALLELAGLFLISAPSIAKEARYTVEPNTGRLVQEIVATMSIDHAALLSKTKSGKTDAIGLGVQKRSNIVGLAISQATAMWRSGDSKEALSIILSVQKKSKVPHPDLLLASGRFYLKQFPPSFDEASRDLELAYKLGQRKQLLFDLWFEAEFGRGALESAREVATMAILDIARDQEKWYERRAQVYVALAVKARNHSSDITSAIREIELAINDIKSARKLSSGELQKSRMNQILNQANVFLENLTYTSTQ